MYIPDIMGAHPYGAITAGLSLIINLLATTLIGIKAWSVVAWSKYTYIDHTLINRRHRASLREHFAEDVGRKYVMKVLALLVETGVVYSATLVSSPTMMTLG